MVATRRVPLVLFLIADTGGGHRSAANAIRAAMDLIATESPQFNQLTPPTGIDPHLLPFSPHHLIPVKWNGVMRPWRSEVRDIIQECGRLPLRRSANMYGPAVEKTPRVYAGFWHVTNTRATYAALSVLTSSLLRRGLSEMLERLRPDVIVSVHGLLTKPTLRIMRMLGVKVPFITVVTDLVRFHRAWAEPKVDVCVVPTEEARELTIAMGVPHNKVRLLGMPIHPKFCLPPAERAATLTAMGLDPTRFTVLLVGGGEGMGSLGEAARAVGQAHLPLQMIVVTGRNKALCAALQADRTMLGTPAKILGFVQNMPDLMRASDVIVTKAGPGAIAESLACGLPIILSGAVPGQEVGNIDYVVDQGVGVLARTPEAIVAEVQRLVQSDPAVLAAMRERARSLSNPRAAFDIAQLIFSYVPPHRSLSAWNEAPRMISRRRIPALVRTRPPGGRSWRFGRRVPPIARLQQLPVIIPPLRRLPLLIRRRTRRQPTA